MKEKEKTPFFGLLKSERISGKGGWGFSHVKPVRRMKIIKSIIRYPGGKKGKDKLSKVFKRVNQIKKGHSTFST